MTDAAIKVNYQILNSEKLKSKSNCSCSHQNISIKKRLRRPHVLALEVFLGTCIVVFVSAYTSCILTNVAFCPFSNTSGTNSSFTKSGVINLSRRLPQCVIIGVRKGGTRALIHFLGLHPDVRTAGREVHFFDDDEHYEQGYEWYRNKMPYSYPGQITMEKTPAYFIDELVPERIHSMNASLKLLLIVRDPIQRTISDYTQLMFNKISHGKRGVQFERLAINRMKGRVNEHYTPIRRSIYHRHMSKWLRYFSLSQFHIVNGERLITDPVSELKSVVRFLGLAPTISENLFYFNETRGFYCVFGSYRDPCLSRSKGRSHPPIRRRVIKILKQFFTRHNELFFKQIGRRFPW